MCLQNLKRFELMKKVRFLTFFLKKFENRSKIALSKNTTLELDACIRNQTKTPHQLRYFFISGRGDNE